MKKLFAISMIPLMVGLAMPVSAHSDHRGDRFENLIERQHKQLKRGKHSGELTRYEVKEIRKKHRHIESLLGHYKKDGKLTKKERKTIRKKLNRTAKMIKKYRDNDDTRPVSRTDFPHFQSKRILGWNNGHRISGVGQRGHYWHRY